MNDLDKMDMAITIMTYIGVSSFAILISLIIYFAFNIFINKNKNLLQRVLIRMKSIPEDKFTVDEKQGLSVEHDGLKVKAHFNKFGEVDLMCFFRENPIPLTKKESAKVYRQFLKSLNNKNKIKEESKINVFGEL